MSTFLKPMGYLTMVAASVAGAGCGPEINAQGANMSMTINNEQPVTLPRPPLKIDQKRERTVYHGIDRAVNNDRTEILEAQYGDSWHTSGTVNMRPADFLYVKWRDKTTDQVYEDRVDLRKRLPPFEEMHGQEIYFLVEDNQLYVYLIPRTEWGTKLNHRPKGQPPNGPFGYRYLDVKTLYPDNDPPQVRGLSERQRERVAREAREEGRDGDDQ